MQACSMDFTLFYIIAPAGYPLGGKNDIFIGNTNSFFFKTDISHRTLLELFSEKHRESQGPFPKFPKMAHVTPYLVCPMHSHYKNQKNTFFWTIYHGIVYKQSRTFFVLKWEENFKKSGCRATLIRVGVHRTFSKKTSGSHSKNSQKKYSGSPYGFSTPIVKDFFQKNTPKNTQKTLFKISSQLSTVFHADSLYSNTYLKGTWLPRLYSHYKRYGSRCCLITRGESLLV